jgi:hypothetical protein
MKITLLSGNHAGTSGYNLTLMSSQLEAIQHLDDYLMQYTYNSKELQMAINTLTKVLYMPKNSHNMLSDNFSSPVIAFACLRAVNPAGGFTPVRHITHCFIGFQCRIHLCIFDVAMQEWRQVTGTGVPVPANWFE